MRCFILLLFGFQLISFSYGQDTVGSGSLDYHALLAETEIEKNKKEERFRDPETSPLPKNEIDGFKGLQYFDPILEKYIVNAKFELIKNGREFEMKTSTDRLPLYRDFAILTFEIEGKTLKLHAYQNVSFAESEHYNNELFIPFKDNTNGDQSYGGGRYLDIKIPEGNEVVLNFALAYNPYCSYNSKYSCPIPPKENHLEIAILAGELKYH